MICPKCNYQRTSADDCVNKGICPSCGIAYNKFITGVDLKKDTDAYKIQLIKQRCRREKKSKDEAVGDDKKLNLFCRIIIKTVAFFVCFYAIVFLIAKIGLVFLLFIIVFCGVYFFIKSGKSIKWSFSKLVFMLFFMVTVLSTFYDVDNGDRKTKISVPLTEKQMIEKSFSSWDGSHINFVRAVKSKMYNPDSFEHVSTRYYKKDDNYIYLLMTYRGSNAFGGIVTNRIKAIADIKDGKIVKVYENN